MVNSKKSTKSLVALIVMAFLLVASIVMAATGAWFSDADQAKDNGVWGEVSLGSMVSVTIADLVLPGDTIIEADQAVAYTGDVDAYYKVTYEITGLDAIEAKYGTVQVGKSINISAIAVPEGLTYDDVTAGESVSVTVTVVVIQKDNLTLNEETGKLTNAAGTEVAWPTYVAPTPGN